MSETVQLTHFDEAETAKLDKEMAKWTETCEAAMKQHDEPPRKKSKHESGIIHMCTYI